MEIEREHNRITRINWNLMGFDEIYSPTDYHSPNVHCNLMTEQRKHSVFDSITFRRMIRRGKFLPMNYHENQLNQSSIITANRQLSQPSNVIFMCSNLSSSYFLTLHHTFTQYYCCFLFAISVSEQCKSGARM